MALDGPYAFYDPAAADLPAILAELPAYVAAAGLAYARARLVPAPDRFRLGVAAWNGRAFRAYERAGFLPGPARCGGRRRSSC